MKKKNSQSEADKEQTYISDVRQQNGDDKTMSNKTKILRKEIQTLINSHKFCWVCGRSNLLSAHHAIPQRIVGVRMNIEVPVCRNCQEIIHINDLVAALLKKIFLKR